MPDDLPPKWSFATRLWPLLSEAKKEIGILEGLGRTLPNPGILLRPLEDREAIRSSRLEGTHATARELLLYEMTPSDQGDRDESRSRQREVFNYRRALHQGMDSYLPLSLRLIRGLHSTLMRGVRGRERSPGEFRSVPVAIGAGRRFVPPPPEEAKKCLSPFENYLHIKSPSFDPLVHCFLVHYQFETIHPFRDGNGRVGRLLLAIMLRDQCDLTKPWLYLSEFFEKNREEYAERLFNVSARAEWEEWIEFCLQGTIQQAKETLQRCERLRAVRENFMNRLKEVGGAVRLNTIVESIFHSPFVRISALPELLDVTYPTAKSDVERLVDAGILQELSSVTPRTFYAPEVFDIAYDEVD